MCRRSALLAVFMLAVSALAAAANDPEILYGMNYNYLSVDTSVLSQCTPQNRNIAARGHAFLAHYGETHVRELVREDLQNMRAAGFSVVRTLVFFGRSG